MRIISVLLFCTSSLWAQVSDPNFVLEAIHWGNGVTVIDWLPDGTLIAGEKRGVLLAMRPDSSGGYEDATTLYDFTDIVDHDGESGLLGLATDPEFDLNRRMYIFYTTFTDQKVASIIINTTTTGIDPGSHEILIEGFPRLTLFHKAGAIEFQPGDADNLYIALGDDDAGSALVQNPDHYHGKILKINKNSGLGLTSNPYYVDDVDTVRARVWAIGFRNPFRFCFHPDVPDSDVLYSSENGEGTDKISWVKKGSNGGWGPDGDAGFLDPDDPNHRVIQTMGPSQLGIAIASSGPFAIDGQDTLYSGNWLLGIHRWHLSGAELDSLSLVTGDSSTLLLERMAADLTFGPDGHLYMTSTGGGESLATWHALQRLRYVGGTPPTASFTNNPSPATGTLPLTVQFTDTSTADAEATLASWLWDFGDGNTSTTQSPSHTYTEAGVYTVSLTVTDSVGLSNTVTATVTANQALQLTLSGSIFDGRSLPASLLSANTSVGFYQADGVTPIPVTGGYGPDGNHLTAVAGVINLTVDLNVTDGGVVISAGEIGADGVEMARLGFPVAAGDSALSRSVDFYLSRMVIYGQVLDTRGAYAGVDVGVARATMNGFIHVAGGRDNAINASGFNHRRDTDQLGFYHFALPDSAAGETFYLDTPADTRVTTLAPITRSVSVALDNTVTEDLVVSRFNGGQDCLDLSGIPETPNVDYVTQIQPIWTNNCVGCHTATATNSGGLDLTGDSMGRLVDVDAAFAPGMKRVEPGSTQRSFLFEKINCDNPQRGNRMRPTDVLDPNDQALVRDWINQLQDCGEPTVITQPQATTACVGSSASFSVTAGGDPTLTYQWFLDEVAISGATSATLNIPSVGNSDFGSYHCTISNGCGVVDTQRVSLSVCAATGPVAHYSFENDFTDETGSFLGIPQGGVGFGSGVIGASASFDGSNDAVLLGQVLPTDPASAFTLSAWVKISSNSGWKTIMGTDNSLAELAVRNAQLRFGENGGGWWLIGPQLTLNRWYHVVGTYDGSQARLYVDGQLVGSPLTRSFARNHGVSLLGRFALNGGEWMNGCLDEARIYSRALSASEVDDQYQTDMAAQNEPPGVTVLRPDNRVFRGDANFLISWSDEDVDDDATLSLYYDSDDSGADGTLIVAGLSEDSPNDSFLWDTSGVSAGTYYIYAVIDDGNNAAVVDYSATSLEIVHSGTLRGFYSLENDLQDDSGFGSDGSGDTGFAAGQVDMAASFDGVDQFAVLGQLLDASPSSAFTLSAWVNLPDLSGWKTILGTEGSFAEIAVRNDRVRFGRNGGGWWLVGPALGIDTWYQVTATYDGSLARLYVNGALVAGPIARSFGNNHDVSLLGSFLATGKELMTGSIDEARVYDRALNDAEVIALYLNDLPFGGNQAPTLQVLTPDADTGTVDRCAFISWTDWDPEENASLAFYYDDDASGGDGTLIVDGLNEDDPTDRYTWDTTAIAAGNYYIYGVIDDGVHPPVTVYSSAAVTVDHSGPFDAEAYLPLDGDALDASGNGHHGSPVGGLVYDVGNQGMAASFDGSDDAIHLDQVLTPNPRASFTLMAWVYLDSDTGWKTIIGTDASFAELAVRNQQLRFGRNRAGGWWLVGDDLNLGQWYHVVGVYDCYQASLYINGQLVAGPVAMDYGNAHGDSLIGRYGLGRGEWMEGRVDDARIFKLGLSATQINDTYLAEVNAERPPVPVSSSASFVLLTAPDAQTQTDAPGTVVSLDWEQDVDQAVIGTDVSFEFREHGSIKARRLIGSLEAGGAEVFNTGVLEDEAVSVFQLPIGEKLILREEVLIDGIWRERELRFQIE